MGGWVWLPRGILLDPCFLILRILIYLVLESLDKGRNFRVEKSGLNSTELEVPWVRYLEMLSSYVWDEVTGEEILATPLL